jgi:carboxymethylenebutenolidase
MDPRIIALYDEFVHSHFDRRLFLEKAADIAGGVAAAMALLPLLQSDYAKASVIAADDPRLITERITFPGATGEVKGYLARPKTDGPQAGILVVHQNRGLNPHIEDIARRLAAEGYAALAVDFLSPAGGTPSDEDKAMKLFATIDNNQAIANALAAAAWLRARPNGNGKVGAIGFCWGGGIVNELAARDPRLNAAVVYYGAPPTSSLIGAIKAPLLLNYADPKIDTRIGALVPAYVEALKAADVKYSLYVYEGANHAFSDDTQVARYDAKAAAAAWEHTLALFKANLG